MPICDSALLTFTYIRCSVYGTSDALYQPPTPENALQSWAIKLQISKINVFALFLVFQMCTRALCDEQT